MAYEYDIFISYRNEFPINQWVFEHFLPFLDPYLKNRLKRDVEIFIDRRRILGGDAWPERIKNALAHTRCLVPIWSPMYFNSDWCLRECAVMRYREQQLGYRTLENPRGLIIPVTVFDGECFPQFAQEIEYLDCKEYLRVGEGYKKTEKYVEFQDLLSEWTIDVSKAINNAPTWSSQWLSKEWLDDTISIVQCPLPPTFSVPTLD